MSYLWHRDDDPIFADGRVYESDWRYPPIAAKRTRRFATATNYADRACQGLAAGWLFTLVVWAITSIG